MTICSRHAIRTGSCLTLLTLALAQSAGAANLLTNASFESPPTTVSLYPSIPGWTRTCGSAVELQSTAGTGWTAAHGTQWWEADGSDNTCLTQTVPSAVNSVYQLTFFYSPRPGVFDNGVEILFNGQVIATLNVDGTNFANTAWQQGIYNVVSYANTATVELRAFGPSNALGGLIDGVTLEPLVCGFCAGDTNGDGVVDFTDIGNLLANNGPCP